MILAFKPQFVEPILSGSKIHTIRHDYHNRWRKDMPIHMATGVRTKKYNCFKEGVCKGTQNIIISHKIGCVDVYIDDKWFGMAYHHGLDDIYEWTNCLEELAKHDGFLNVDDFFAWFNEDFEGKLIHWTEKRY